MLDLEVHYIREANKKFFNDNEERKYHQLSVTNSEIIPKECLYFSENRGNYPCTIWILDDLLKAEKINLGYPLEEAIIKYKFVINLEEKKVAKFNTNNKNWMVLKTKDYFQNTVKKIGFWDSEDYFYELSKKQKKPTKISSNSPVKAENKTDWGKIAFFCLPIIILVFFIFLIINWVGKKKK